MRLRLFKIGIPAILIAGIFIFIFKVNLLRSVSNYLIDIDKPEEVEVVFVLGGNSYDRGRKAAEMYHDGYAEKIVCLGENIPVFYKAMGIDKTESEMSRDFIIRDFMVDSLDVIALKKGTSTMEESQYIHQYCVNNNLERVMIVSSLLHTNRIRGVFDSKFDDSGIDYLLIGTPSSIYDEENWWVSEEGLIMVNNEYVKTLYYWLKY